jgi:hypothetical protein
MANKYRCYLLNLDCIAAVKVLEADGDAAAVLEADKILATSSCTAAELWDRERRVSIISRKSPAA